MCKLFLKLDGNITFTFVFLGELSKGNTAVSEKVAAARKIQSFHRKYKIHQKLKPGLKHPCL